ncbi:MAG: hypothetical protein JO279_12540 [Verrucomicrobia bacterium]|nr:hypothetical protein [Verrucomicrobiota bacterium]
MSFSTSINAWKSARNALHWGMLITEVGFFLRVGALFLWCLGTGSALAQGTQSVAIITPGQGIGPVLLGQTLAEVHARLGAPKLSDAALGGRLWEIWRSGPAFEGKRQNGFEELEIYFTREHLHFGGPSAVGQIRVTSPFSRTVSGISIRSSFSQILDSFPNLRIDEELTYALNGERSEKDVAMYVDRTRGIAFEFRNGAAADPNVAGYCRAIHVFRPGTDPRIMEAFDLQ